MTLYEVTLGPFVEFGFMRRALVGCLALAGVLLAIAGPREQGRAYRA